jgi:hypothetical protein
MHRQYTTYIKQLGDIWLHVSAETCSQISRNCNYCILFDVCCVLTVHNTLYRFVNTQRDGLSKTKLIILYKISHLVDVSFYFKNHNNIACTRLVV